MSVNLHPEKQPGPSVLSLLFGANSTFHKLAQSANAPLCISMTLSGIRTHRILLSENSPSSITVSESGSSTSLMRCHLLRGWPQNIYVFGGNLTIMGSSSPSLSTLTSRFCGIKIVPKEWQSQHIRKFMYYNLLPSYMWILLSASHPTKASFCMFSTLAGITMF